MMNWLKKRWGREEKPPTPWQRVPKEEKAKLALKAAIIAVLAVGGGVLAAGLIGIFNPMTGLPFWYFFTN